MGRRKQKHSADEATIQTRVAQFETKTHEIALALDKEWKGVQVNLDSNAKDLFPKLQPSTQQYLAIAQAISGRISRFIDKLAKSPWKMRTENLVHHFGAGIFLSYDFFTELYGFASAAEKKDLSWEEAWSALEHARIRRKENVDKRQRVSLQDDWTPSDVRDAMKAKGLLSKQLPQPTITNSATTEQQRVTSTSSCNTRHEQGSPPPSASYKSAPQESGLPPNTSPQPQPYLSVTGASPARGRTPSVPPSTPIYRQHSPFYKVEAESSLKRRSASSNCDASPRKQRKLTTTSESCEVEKKDPRDIDLKEGTGPEQNNSSPTIEAGRPGDHDLAIDQNSDDLQLGVSFNIDSDDNVDGHGSKYAKGKSRLLSESLEDHGSFVDDPGTAYDTPSPPA
ncbi:hypothetical protein H2203_009307 [Taxawa tesnikishii (nom. ined.)]|nr:hypothetical protein H2203_009307 [Dothideales sp. JES 119]